MTSNSRMFIINYGARDCNANFISYASFLQRALSLLGEAAAAMEKPVSLGVCFELGKALRYSDAERFLNIYDSLLQDGSVEQNMQVSTHLPSVYKSSLTG